MKRGRLLSKIRTRHLITFLCVAVFWYLVVGFYHAHKILPKGISFSGPTREVSDSDIDFLYDLTYEDSRGERRYQQEIFSKVFDLIDNANKFIVIDMFLFNSDYAGKERLIPLSEVMSLKLIEKKKENPDIKIVFITDEINNFYGSYESELITKLKENNVPVVITDLTKLRDSNPWYSSIWRTYFQWFGTRGDGSIAHPLGRPDTKVTVRSFLKLMNTKANHRKVIVTDSKKGYSAIVTSANPHNASSLHSNIAFLVSGQIASDILESEKYIALMSDGVFDIEISEIESPKKGGIGVQLLTEGKIKQALLYDIDNSKFGDSIDMAIFYLSDRDIVRALIGASKRGVSIRIIMDANKDAFAREKNGIPNRQTASELVEKSGGKIEVRWYNSHGEQFHTKLTIIKRKENSVIYGGSSNYTRRNLNNLNLESVLKIIAPNDSNLAGEVRDYFGMIWDSKKIKYTIPYEDYKDQSLSKYWLYRIQEFTGFSSF